MKCKKCGTEMRECGFVRKVKYTYSEYICINPDCKYIWLDEENRELNLEVVPKPLNIGQW